MAKRFRLRATVQYYDTTSDLVNGVITKTFNSTGASDPDYPVARSGVRLMNYAVTFDVQNLLIDPFPLGHNYLNLPRRWKRFCMDYLPPSFESWLDSLADIRTTGEFPLAFQTDMFHVISGCLSYLSFHRHPYPGITLVSRATRLFPEGTLDLALMTLIARTLRQRGIVKPGTPISLAWFVSHFQVDLGMAISYLQLLGLDQAPTKWVRSVTQGQRAKPRITAMRALAVAQRNKQSGFTPWYPSGIWKSDGTFLPLADSPLADPQASDNPPQQLGQNLAVKPPFPR